ADEQGGGGQRQAGRTQEGIDLGQGIGEDHGRLLPRRKMMAVTNHHATAQADRREGVFFLPKTGSGQRFSATSKLARRVSVRNFLAGVIPGGRRHVQPCPVVRLTPPGPAFTGSPAPLSFSPARGP